MGKRERYRKGFTALIVGLFVLAALVPVTVVGISSLIIAGKYLSTPPTTAADPFALGYFLKAAFLATLLLSAIFAPLLALFLSRRITNTLTEIIRKRGATEISSLKAGTEDITSTMTEALVFVDGDWRVKSSNRAFLELLGCDEKDVTGRPFDALYEEPPFTGPLFERLLREGSVRGLEMFLRTSDGEKIPVSVSASRSGRSADRTGGFVVLARDLSERKALYEELGVTNLELAKRVKLLAEFRQGVFYILRDLDRNEQELNEAYAKLKGAEAQLVHSGKLSALGQVSAGVAHEMNQPLTVIRGLAQNMLRTTGGDGKEYEKMKLIDGAARRMEGFVKHLKAFTKVEEAALSDVDLNRVIDDAFIMVKQYLNRPRFVQVRFELSKLPKVVGSAHSLEQVFINLMTNAKDAMPEGGVITVSTDCVEREGRRFVRATLMDTGAGMPEETIGRIFDPFFTTRDKGIGLGLSISHDIIRDHKGEIRVESGRGEGTKFEIMLPSGV